MNENQHIEWKQSWRDEHLKWICAFANTGGGVLTIGKDDTGQVIGVDQTKALLENVPSKIKSTLGIIASVELQHRQDQAYIDITVQGYANAISYRGKYYVRSGSTTHELNGADLAEFLISKSGQTWDELIAEDATIDDIDRNSILKLLVDSKATNRLPNCEGLSDLEILQKMRLAKGDALKRAAVVLFGKDPNVFFPNCKVMIGRFGTDATDLKFQEIVEGNVVYLLQEVQQQLNYKFLTRPVDFEGMHRTEKDEYPVAALREMLLNALVHKRYMGAAVQLRVYDDRLSIWNEGELPKGITVESLRDEHNSKPANPVLAEACFKAGYIDTWGRGTLKIYAACAEVGLPEPSILEKDGGIEVTLFKLNASEKVSAYFGETSENLSTDFSANQLLMISDYWKFSAYLQESLGITSEKLRRNFGETSREFRSKFGDKKALLLFLIAVDSTISANSAADQIGVSARSVETYLSDLKKEGIIERIGPAKGGIWRIIAD